ncbi:hypothetical protein [Synechococcus elongatus]|uniref:hypothetical protein n=1 Tax=Synechococcus elongatus TaxID=32046 RepID=UPI000F7F65D4|nr:hypothetical protein [Synechococcus elongatus]
MARQRKITTAPKDGRRIVLIVQEHKFHDLGYQRGVVQSQSEARRPGLWHPFTQSWVTSRDYPTRTWEQQPDGRWISNDGNAEIVGWWDPDAPADQDDEQEDW